MSNLAVHFSSAVDTWTTPRDFYDRLNDEFQFVLDAAALRNSALCDQWYGPDHDDESRRDALTADWSIAAEGGAVFMNPPYGRQIGKFMKKANEEALGGLTVVCLVPARTDTAWWHDYAIHWKTRFVRGRLKFGDATNAAPFPSAVIIMGRLAND